MVIFTDNQLLETQRMVCLTFIFQWLTSQWVYSKCVSFLKLVMQYTKEIWFFRTNLILTPRPVHISNQSQGDKNTAHGCHCAY